MQRVVDRRQFLRLAGLGGVVLASGMGAGALAQAREEVVRVTARKFAFLPNELRLKKGVPVTLEFVSADVVMGFNAPDFNIRTDIIPGQVSRLRFVPDKAGTFVFLCDVFCGDGHEGMSGQIHVAA
jgi:cytochrome c oxidase subunit 2